MLVPWRAMVVTWLLEEEIGTSKEHIHKAQGHPRLCQDTARAGVVCVGDKAMLQVEEPISYPLNEVGGPLSDPWFRDIFEEAFRSPIFFVAITGVEIVFSWAKVVVFVALKFEVVSFNHGSMCLTILEAGGIPTSWFLWWASGAARSVYFKLPTHVLEKNAYFA